MSLSTFIRPATLTFVGRKKVAPDTFCFYIRPESKIAWRAGQHGMLEITAAGGKAKLRGPVGPMYVRNPEQHHIFIASGIGITPFRSTPTEAAAHTRTLRGTLLTKPDQLTTDIVRTSSPDLATSMFYLAGSPSSIKQYKKMLRQLGVTRSQIKNDPFFGYK